MPSYGVVPSASSPGASITTASSIPPVSGNGGAELPLAELEGKTMVDQASYSPLFKGLYSPIQCLNSDSMARQSACAGEQDKRGCRKSTAYGTHGLCN